MKDKKLTIQINRPVPDVFEFTTDPKNTHLWIDSIVHEESNEWPVKIGTIFSNRNKEGKWSEYEVTSFEKDKSFVFSLKGGSYHVQYTFKGLPNNGCELVYYEWVDEGELLDTISMEILKKLKTILEG